VQLAEDGKIAQLSKPARQPPPFFHPNANRQRKVDSAFWFPEGRSDTLKGAGDSDGRVVIRAICEVLRFAQNDGFLRADVLVVP
jgi:hypothetical protein